jgi:hypothetical protein
MSLAAAAGLELEPIIEGRPIQPLTRLDQRQRATRAALSVLGAHRGT